jgi:hypothetical protein
MEEQENKTDEQSPPAELCSFENCSKENNPIVGKCLKCHLHYCLDHASEVDPINYCIICLPTADVETKSEPLIDAEGVRHEGRRIVPIGAAFHHASKMINEMSNVELLAFIEQEHQIVKDLENVKTYHQITLGQAEFTAYERKISVLAKIGGEIRVGTSTVHVRANARVRESKPPLSDADKALKALKALGMTTEQITALLSSHVKK